MADVYKGAGEEAEDDGGEQRELPAVSGVVEDADDGDADDAGHCPGRVGEAEQRPRVLRRHVLVRAVEAGEREAVEAERERDARDAAVRSLHKRHESSSARAGGEGGAWSSQVAWVRGGTGRCCVQCQQVIAGACAMHGAIRRVLAVAFLLHDTGLCTGTAETQDEGACLIRGRERVRQQGGRGGGWLKGS